MSHARTDQSPLANDVAGWPIETLLASGLTNEVRASTDDGGSRSSADFGSPSPLSMLLNLTGNAAALTEQGRLVQARLGVATSLFVALRCKHAETASHCLRVALTCSVWGAEQNLPAEEREALEIAALLHDVGKIGLPDRILLKPTKLTDEELAIVDRHRLMGVEILSACCGSLRALEIVSNAPAWFNGQRMKLETQGIELPLGARMLSIADAYDSMTSDHVYRAARSHDSAIKELYECASSQFDPELVEQFDRLHQQNCNRWRTEAQRHWLEDLDPPTVNLYWQLHRSFARRDTVVPALLFQQRLLDNMYDGVIFLDANRQVMLWNRGAERLTGVASSTAYQRQFLPQMLRLATENGVEFTEAECPVAQAMGSASQSVHRLQMRGADARDLLIDLQTIPVVGNDGLLYGAALLLHDASGQVSLEERCQNLHDKATRDSLTQLANRAEFDRMHALFVDVHLERNAPCSLIIADIDRFKTVNDNYGHQAGDEAIKSFARLMKSFCRPSDLAARYGGEEFVLLCTNYTNAMAAARAEELRVAFSQLPQPSMTGACITASFGVTELQRGDTPATMLHRADRALLSAKETGRNRVVQLGAGIGQPPTKERRRFGWWPFRSAGQGKVEVTGSLVTTVPLRVAIEKLRGFVADHHAEILRLDSDLLTLEVGEAHYALGRRNSDRPVPLIAELSFIEEQLAVGAREGSISRRTRIEVTVRTKRSRDRRKDSGLESAKQLLQSLKAYLMADDYVAGDGRSVLRKAKGALVPWLVKKPDEAQG